MRARQPCALAAHGGWERRCTMRKRCAGSWPCWSTHVDRLLRSDAGAGRALAAREVAHSRALAARLCRTIALRSSAGCFVDCALVAYPARLLAETSRDACGVMLRTMRAGRATLRAASCAAAAIFVVVAPTAAPASLRRCRDGWSEFF
ncbi:hypothetical protein F511_46631 [Dorcoceras hygrometricum]|uniref:Uncharacterized protein n=1 Tax=Dorcoceras hygrometricum TaxID=472368 RepID=A0A2Z6ZT22_9LAMI|nr:hypothetical protein F511_46631 [Dorcoceras hygrometricum]